MLLDPDRQSPVVVLSTSRGQDEPWFDTSDVAASVVGLAEVAVLRTDAASWRLSELLPDRTGVYGGAARTYPAGLHWTRNDALAPLRFAYGDHDRTRATDQVIHDALGMSGTAVHPPEARPSSQPAKGVVKLLAPPSRAMVELADGSPATIWQELTVAEVPIDRLLQRGQRVRGTWDPAAKRLDIKAMLVPDAEVVAHYRPDDVVLTRVSEVHSDVVHLALHPRVIVAVPKDRVTSNPLDSMTALFTVGETVLARIDGDTRHLRLDDIDDGDAPRPAPALIDGGPAWLLEPEDRTDDDAPAPPVPLTELSRTGLAPATPPTEPTAPTPTPLRPDPPATTRRRVPTPRDLRGRPGPAAGAPPAPPTSTAPLSPTPPVRRPTPAAPAPPLSATPPTHMPAPAPSAGQPALSALRTPTVPAAEDLADGEVRALRERAQALEATVAELAAKVQNQKTALRKEKQRSQASNHKARRAHQTGHEGADEPAFLDPKKQFRHEVYLEWARRIPASEKKRLPLARYLLDDGFLTSIDATQGADRGKVIQVVVEVLTGLAENLDGRDLHTLRESASGGSPARTHDGWTCWRVALQRESPAARRMHFWRRGEEIRLSRVSTHDDMRA